jgi:pimeloyl-ACP methyl ester carboxylesterase
MELLAPKFHVFAVDSYDAGKSPAWKGEQTATLSDEVALIEPVLARAGDSLTLIGHSYGGAVALMAALKHRKQVRALALYEPTLFALIEAESPPPNDADGICAAVARSVAALDAGEADAAAAHFIDYWMGAGSWAAMPEPRRGPIAASIRNIRSWSRALLREPTPLAAFASLDLPVLYLMGKKSPASSRGVARILMRVLPRVEALELDSLGHMGPVTHADVVNAAIARFLERW